MVGVCGGERRMVGVCGGERKDGRSLWWEEEGW